jgi:hypothetical protein
MKAWTGNDVWAEELWIGQHATAGRAKRAYASDVGCDFVEARVLRCPAMDDLPLTARNLLMTGTCESHDCSGCSRQIYGEGLEEGEPSIGSWHLPHPVGPLVSDRWGRLWCSEACYTKWFRQWGGSDPLIQHAR